MSKNLTEIVKHPLSKKNVPGYIHEIGETDEHYITRRPSDGIAIYTGPIVDRLHEFESLGMEPEDIKALMAAHSDLLEKYAPKKVSSHSVFHEHDKYSPHGTIHMVKECRYYLCPRCGNELANRYKLTKLYPNRTIGTEGCYGPIAYPSRDHCHICMQDLDWSDVDKETWA